MINHVTTLLIDNVVRIYYLVMLASSRGLSLMLQINYWNATVWKALSNGLEGNCVNHAARLKLKLKNLFYLNIGSLFEHFCSI